MTLDSSGTRGWRAPRGLAGVLACLLCVFGCAKDRDDASAAGGTAGTGGAPTSGGLPGAGGTSGGAGSPGLGGSSAAARFPFPQRFETAHCQLPATARPSDVTAAYEHWKRTLLTSEGAGGHLRVRRPNSKGAVVNSTVSEGIAYGMLIAVAMNDPTTFDELWKYSQLHLNANGLMNWYIDPTGTRALGEGAATDSDEDIAFALVLADRQWGGRGSLSDDYLTLAKRQIDLVWKFEVDHGAEDVLKPGDRWGGAQLTNPSYFAPAYYRTFARISGEQGWLRVVDSSYDIIEACLNAKSGNSENGLVPAWCTAAGEPTHNPQHFQFDSCRTPFRIAQDYCYYGEPRARAYLEKITSFYAGIGLANLVDGFELDGKPRPEFSVNGTRAAAFVGPAGVGAMFDPAHAKFVEGAYSDLITPGALQIGDAAFTNAGSIYYNTSWRVLSLLMLNGALYDYTLLEAP